MAGTDQRGDAADRRYAKRAEFDQLAARVAALSAPKPATRPRPHVTLGEQCSIDPTVTLWARDDAPITIGDRVKIYRGGEFLGPVSIGARTFINRDAYVRAGTSIGSDCAIGPFVRILTDTHQVGPAPRRAGALLTKPTTVGNGCWVGACAVILPGVTIGDGCIIAAGAVVAADVPANSLVGGVPAKVLRTLN